MSPLTISTATATDASSAANGAERPPAFNGLVTATVTACSHGPRSLGTSDRRDTARGRSAVHSGYQPRRKGSANEWRGTRRAFNQFDLNGDGVLTRRELSIGADPAVATSGQSIRVDPAQGWTDTGITVDAGATLIVEAEGTAQLSDNSNDVATPFGARSGRRASQAPLPPGACWRFDAAGSTIPRRSLSATG